MSYDDGKFVFERDYKLPNLPPHWHSCQSPRTYRPTTERPDIINEVTEGIGMTPLLRLNKIPKAEGLRCEVLAKCEYMNPGGSIKDRIAIRMVLDAEEAGLIRPGYTLIEPTSGNTGIGVAMVGAARGYKVIIVMPDKNSDEKCNVLKALGATLVKTKSGVPYTSPESHIAIAQKMHKEMPCSFVLDQHVNPSNPLAHYDGTGPEILRQCGGRLDMVVIGTGTGGSISGIGHYLKAYLPDIKIIGVDPYGSLMAEPPSINETDITSYKIEGIGYDFVSTVCDRCVVDEWIKTCDKESFQMARRLIREEGVLCGGSSGSIMAAAVKAAAELHEGQRCVVLLPDNIRNYLTKFVSDSWMIEHGFYESPCQ